MNSSNIVLVCITFCIAFVISSAINRPPKVIIQPVGGRDDATGCVGTLLTLLVLAGIIMWALLPNV